MDFLVHANQISNLGREELTTRKELTTPLMNNLQFAYRSNRSVDDIVNLALHQILQHLDSSRTLKYACVLFMDFSSAFNIIDPVNGH